MKQLAIHRERTGYTQADVARHLKVDRSAVAKWETGASKPRIDRLLKLAKLYGCTVDELVKEESA